MGYSKEVYDTAWETLGRRKHNAENLTAANREEVLEKIPQIATIERDMARTASSIAKVILSEPQNTRARIDELKQLSLSLQAKRGELLQEHGFSSDYLEQQYHCEKCKDKGYIGAKMCSCFEDILKQSAYSQLGATSQMRECSFDNFSLHFYPASPSDASGIIPRDRMAQILEHCKQYAKGFTPCSESLLMLGHTGLGKTHLSLAIASAITDRGYGVMYTPVQKLIDKLESDKFSRDSHDREQYINSLDFVLECDLLVLDDLGTEFYTQFTASVLYNIINSRLVENKPTIISTNLEIQQIEEKYSQRMVSRLVCSYKVLKFHGKDIRFIKRTK